MTKKITGLIIGVTVIVIVILLFKNPDNLKPSQTNQSKIQVVASFYPLADFSKNMGGDLVEVINITPAGAEPHDYEPTPQDIVKIYNAKLFVFNGNGVDAWADKLKPELESRGIQTIRIADNLSSLKSNAENGESLEHDPHFWLNPVNVEKEVDLIAQALIKVDPDHESEYNKKREEYKQQLMALDQEYKTGLSNCLQREIVTAHNAFNYLADRYNLSTLYVLGLSPDEEPSPKTIAEVADQAKKKNIKYIFFESLVSPKLAQTIAAEIGAQTLELNPIEGLTDEEIALGENYVSIMKSNLVNLRTALSCQ